MIFTVCHVLTGSYGFALLRSRLCVKSPVDHRRCLRLCNSNMSSGITPTDECVSLFNDMKLKHDRKWIIFKIDDKQIVKEREGDKDATYESFMAALKEVAENEPRYAVVDYHYKTEDGRPQDKLLFIAWSPDTCGVKPKMTYASSKDALLKKLNGVHKAFRRTKPHFFKMYTCGHIRSDSDFAQSVPQVVFHHLAWVQAIDTSLDTSWRRPIRHMRQMAHGVRIPLNIFQTYIYIYMYHYVSIDIKSQLLFVISCCFNVVSMFFQCVPSPCGIAVWGFADHRIFRSGSQGNREPAEVSAPSCPGSPGSAQGQDGQGLCRVVPIANSGPWCHGSCHSVAYCLWGWWATCMSWKLWNSYYSCTILYYVVLVDS